MAVRCLRCGSSVEGLTQLCESCSETKRQQEQDLTARAVMATSMTCPTCSETIARASDACPNCQHDFTVKVRDWSFQENIGFGARFVAWLIDSVVLWVISGFVLVASGDILVTIALGGPIALFYHVMFTTSGGATPGKMVMRIKVMTWRHQDVGLTEAIVRHMTSSMLFGVSHAFIFFNEEKRALHDSFSGTIVCRADYEERLAAVRGEATS